MDTNTNCASEEGGDTNSSDDPWVTLNGSKKEFSRLLYPNPVCFLCTPSCGYPGEEEDYHENVMTISWLSAINNEGCFVMSLNRRRATARYFKNHHHNLDTGCEFCLCVPIAGMESLVLAVGRTSQRFASKFPRVEKDSPSKTKNNNNNNTAPNAGGVVPNMSKRQRKRLEHIGCVENGIPGLIRVPFGNGGGVTNTRLFCIEGTVAHMHCRTYRIVDENVDTQQDTHCIIYAQVMNAVCRSSYWNSHKKVFCSAHGEKPILTFLGSQTFGEVHKRDEVYVSTCSPAGGLSLCGYHSEATCLMTKKLGFAPGRPVDDDDSPAFLANALTPPRESEI